LLRWIDEKCSITINRLNHKQQVKAYNHTSLQRERMMKKQGRQIMGHAGAQCKEAEKTGIKADLREQ